MAPPRNPAPKPQPNPLPHTVTTSVAVAFLIASASAKGVAHAVLEAAAIPAASTAATDMFSIRLDIGFLRFFRASASVYANRIPAPTSLCGRYATEIRRAGLIRQGLVSEHQASIERASGCLVVAGRLVKCESRRQLCISSGLTLTLVSVIPGRGLLPASPESITLGWWLWIPGSPL